MRLTEMIDQAGRLNMEIKTKEKRLKGLKAEIKERSKAGDNLGKKYVCKKVITEMYEDLDPETVFNKFIKLKLTNVQFLECCKVQMKLVREFLAPVVIDDMRESAKDKVALTFKKR